LSGLGPIALIFPGQGCQHVGMGADLAAAFPEARAAFAEADEALGEPLSQLMFHGPEDALARTANSQPAILAHSVALWLALKNRLRVQPVAAAGHSLGEYSALVAAAPGTGMLAILGLELEAVQQLCEHAARDGELAAVANYNCPGQVVVGGHIAALERLCALASAAGARKVLRLPISVASHTPLLAPAAAALAERLASLPLGEARFPVVGNALRRPLRASAEIREELVAQLVRPVDWPACVAGLAGLGAGEFWELGPKPVLSGLCRRIPSCPPARAITAAQELEELLRMFS
jgi:[acyl-carrier-protein] S-malonyltransferase